MGMGNGNGEWEKGWKQGMGTANGEQGIGKGMGNEEQGMGMWNREWEHRTHGNGE